MKKWKDRVFVSSNETTMEAPDEAKLPPYIAYIVNCQDAVNYDITIENADGDIVIGSEALTSICLIEEGEIRGDVYVARGVSKHKVYRARLKGLSISKEEHPEQQRRSSGALRKTEASQISRPLISKLIRRTKGWFLCEVHGVDNYNRVLVTLYDPITKRSLKEFLLSEFPKHFAEYVERTSSG